MSLHLLRHRWMLAVMAALALILITAARTDGSVRTSTTLQRVAFVSATRGVGLFETATGKYPGHCVLDTRATNNGGKSFEAAGRASREDSMGNGEAFSQIAFNGGGVLFAYGPGLAVSHNMGGSWTSPTILRSGRRSRGERRLDVGVGNAMSRRSADMQADPAGVERWRQQLASTWRCSRRTVRSHPGWRSTASSG